MFHGQNIVVSRHDTHHFEKASSQRSLIPDAANLKNVDLVPVAVQVPRLSHFRSLKCTLSISTINVALADTPTGLTEQKVDLSTLLGIKIFTNWSKG